MKTFILFLLLLVPQLTYAQAQPAPNREDEVKQLVARYRPMLDGSDDKGRVVTGLVCNDLNRLDAGQWGMLIKNDRNPPFVPYDILVWRPTKEHFDVLSGLNSNWQNAGVIPISWDWLACPASSPDTTPPPVVTPPPPQAESNVLPVVLDLQRLANAIYAFDVAHEAAELNRAEAAAAQLKAHDENPAFLTKVLSNHYVQIVLTALGTYFTTQQVMK